MAFVCSDYVFVRLDYLAELSGVDDYGRLIINRNLASFLELGTQSLPSLFVYATQQPVRDLKRCAFATVTQKNKQSNSDEAPGERR